MLKIVDFYRVLQVDPAADPEVIRAAYRSLARKYHPDLAEGSGERMVAINEAWAVVGDDRARAAYDRGRVALDPIGQPPAAGHRDPTVRSVSGTPPGRPSGTVLGFGRYAGWSFGQIARHDPGFLEWLAGSQIGRSYRVEIEALLATGAPVPAARAGRSTRRGFGLGR
jgi:curved DNA-binding protein CbpA